MRKPEDWSAPAADGGGSLRTHDHLPAGPDWRSACVSLASLPSSAASRPGTRPSSSICLSSARTSSSVALFGRRGASQLSSGVFFFGADDEVGPMGICSEFGGEWRSEASSSPGHHARPLLALALALLRILLPMPPCSPRKEGRPS
jgi:hypothetical protein